MDRLAVWDQGHLEARPQACILTSDRDTSDHLHGEQSKEKIEEQVKVVRMFTVIRGRTRK